jgi:signal transduction histidine kinase
MRTTLWQPLLAAAAALPAVVVALGDGRPATAATAAVLGLTLVVGRARGRAGWLLAVVVLAATAPVRSASLLGAGSDPVGELLLLALAFAAGRGDHRWPALVAVLTFTGLEEAMAGFAHDFPGFWFAPLAGGAAGFALRERALVVAQLEAQARQREAEREAYTSLSVRYERAQIASELHDIVAHAISVMVVQASAGRRIVERDPEAAAGALSVIAGAAHEAEADLMRLVALLSDQDGPASEGLPGLARIEELVVRAAGSGLDVTLRLAGDCADVEPGLAHVAFRIVQEALTNALRYASGAAVVVTLRGDRDVLAIEVVNGRPARRAPLEGVGGGRGLPGLRARVGAVGGTLAAGPTDASGWRVAARLPRARSLATPGAAQTRR